IWNWYRLQRDDGSGWHDLASEDQAALASGAYAAQLDQLDRMMRGHEHTLATFREALQVQEGVEQLLG
ncbi:MAG: hypothetical protein AAF480_06570, partial [Actinomycetota bacterium]